MTTAVPVPAPVPASSSRMALAPISNSKLNSNSNVKSNGHLKPFASSTPFLKRSITLDMNLLPSLKRRLSNSGKEMGMGKHVLQNFNYSTSLTAAAMSAAAYPSPIPTPTIGENLENLERSEKLEKLEKKLNHAELLKTRLRLAYYKIKSNQVDTPISKIVDTSREFTKTPLIKRAQTLEMLLASSTPLINSMQYPLPTSIPPHHPILKKNYNSTRKKSSNFKNIKNIKKKNLQKSKLKSKSVNFINNEKTFQLVPRPTSIYTTSSPSKFACQTQIQAQQQFPKNFIFKYSPPSPPKSIQNLKNNNNNMNSQIKRKRELKPANKKKEIINNDIKLPSLSEIPLNIDKFPKQNSSSVVPTKLSAESQTSSHYDNNDSTILLVTPVKKKKSGITKSQHAAKVVNSSLPTVPTLRHNSTNEIINDNNTPQLMSSPSKYLSTPSSMGAAKSLLQLALLNQD